MRKLKMFLVSVIMMLLGLTSAFGATGKSLVIYYSLSGNTKTIAQYIHKAVGGDMVEIKTVNAYPTEFEEVVLQARQERQSGYLPPIQPINVNLNDYDTIYLGFPIWGTTLPQPMATFLTQNKNSLVGKTIVPFSTHDGFGIGRSRQAINEYCPDSTLLESFDMVGADAQIGEQRVLQWLNKLSLMPQNAVSSHATQQTPIRISIGNIQLDGFLNNNHESRQFVDILPKTVSMVSYGGREYYGGIAERLNIEQQGQLNFEDGDITYCPQNNTIAIFFAQTSRPNLTMRVIPIGKVTSDLSAFKSMGSSVEVRFSLVH